MNKTSRYCLLKFTVSICFLYSITIFSIAAQTCYPNGITFTSQSQIDQFSSLNPGCKVIGGNLIIDGFSIANLDSLFPIEVIEGKFEIYASSLTNFEGLNNLDTIKQELFVAGNSFNLVNFEGLENLKVLGANSDYHILQGSSITDFSGLGSLQSISGTLLVTYCYNLTSLSGLESISQIDGLDLNNCSMLSSLGFSNEMNLTQLNLEVLPLLSNLDGIEYINNLNSIDLIQLSGLIKMDSLSSLSSIQNLTINNCDMLTNLNGLQGLSEIQNSLSLRYNNLLVDISALANVDFSPSSSLEIRSNPSLSECHASSICYHLGAEGSSTIINNEVGCNTENEVLIECCISDPDLCPDSIFTCVPEGITFSTQAEVDLFPLIYPGCQTIGGNIIISGNDITQLDSLYSIETIEGTIFVYNNSLSNFQGLNNLDTIKQGFIINNLGNGPINFVGLESLKSIGSSYSQLYINNPNIVDFTGLDSLQEINGDLVISNCSSFTSISGLKNLSKINDLYINNCSIFSFFDLSENLVLNNLSLYNLPSLSNLNGLEHLQNASSLKFEKLDNLTNIDSLQSLTTILDLDITNCDLLNNLTGLQNLSEIQNSISFRLNNILDDISAIENVDLSNLTTITIQDNPNLSVCNLNSICDFISDEGTILIEDNAEGCNTEAELIVTCCSKNSIWCPIPMDTCLVGGITFSSQYEVDIFSSAYPSCKVIEGDLVIDGIDILTLDSLYSIEVISGDLSLEESSIVNFEGLNNLDIIKQELHINGYYNSMINFEGLESLKQLGMGYYNDHIISFASIEDFTGLDSLQKINGKLEINNCYNLNSLSGLDQLSEIYELEVRSCLPFSELGLSHKLSATGIILYELPGLVNLNGIENVDSLFSLTLLYLNELLSIDSLHVIDTLSNLSIKNCNKLQSLNGLHGLNTLTNYHLKIEDNNELKDISALNDVDLSSLNSLVIRDNPNLSTCNHASICEYIEMGGNSTISDNAVGCNNLVEIEYDCVGLLSIFEENNNGITGNTDNFWHNPLNWKNSEIPNESSYVIFPANSECFIQSDSIANCQILDIRNDCFILLGNASQLNVLEE